MRRLCGRRLRGWLYGTPLALAFNFHPSRYGVPVQLSYLYAYEAEVDRAVAFLRRFRGVIAVLHHKPCFGYMKTKLCRARIPWVDAPEAAPEARAIKAAANLAEGVKLARLDRQLEWSLGRKWLRNRLGWPKQQFKLQVGRMNV